MFPWDVASQILLKSDAVSPSYSKNEKGDVFETQCRIQYPNCPLHASGILCSAKFV